jgi:type-F conjugative transfer system pilin assembly protein TrbC
MKKTALSFLLCSSLLVADEVQDFFSSLPPANEEEAQDLLASDLEKTFEEALPSSPAESSSKCVTVTHFPIGYIEKKQKCSRSNSHATDPSFSEKPYQLLVFMSFSAPIPTWKEFSSVLVTGKGAFVLRGIPSNSFSLFSKRVEELRKEGIYAPILIDPEAFERYAIDAIPSVVLFDGSKYDKLVGNRLLLSSLQLLAEQGETKTLAHKIYSELKTGYTEKK